MKVFVSQAIKIPLSFLAKFLINTVHRRKNVQVQDVEQNDRDLGALGQAIDEFKHLQRAPGNIHREQNSLGLHGIQWTSTCIIGSRFLISVRAYFGYFLAGNRDVWRFWPPLPSGEPRKERGESRWKSDQQRHEEKQVDK